jgi:hypothetical protein
MSFGVFSGPQKEALDLFPVSFHCFITAALLPLLIFRHKVGHCLQELS